MIILKNHDNKNLYYEAMREHSAFNVVGPAKHLPTIEYNLNMTSAYHVAKERNQLPGARAWLHYTLQLRYKNIG